MSTPAIEDHDHRRWSEEQADTATRDFDRLHECKGDPKCEAPTDETEECGDCGEFFCAKHMREGFCIACIDEPLQGEEFAA